MDALELKIPPLLLTALFAAGMTAVAAITTGLAAPAFSRVLAAGSLVASGVIISVAGVVSFRRVHTTVNPTKPDASSALVVTGIYLKTRNPMYVGFLCVLLAVAVLLANPICYVVAASFVPYMNRFQIVPEERALESSFGEECRRYKSRVRRWL